MNEKRKENEKLIKELTQKLEQNKKMNRDYTRNASIFWKGMTRGLRMVSLPAAVQRSKKEGRSGLSKAGRE